MTSLPARNKSSKSKAGFLIRVVLAILILLATTYEPQFPSMAAPSLTVEPITWNVIGLDSNDPQAGPNTFPVGARVCNEGAETASDLTATFVFDDGEDLFDSDSYINLRDGSLAVIGPTTLGAGTPENPTCTDFYFEAEIKRDGNAYKKTRLYHIEVTAAGGILLSTPTPRELYVEYLISQSRNSTDAVELDGVPVPPGGTMTLTVDSTYEIKLYGSTATNGYEQIETFLHLPNTIFQVLSVWTLYEADSSDYVDNPNNKLYGDGCLWENDPNSPNYRSCLDVGKNGGQIEVTYQVKVIGGAGTSETLNSLIYDFSGSSYHYNSDFSSSARIINIVGPSSITIRKQFVPDHIPPGGTSTLMITLTNPTTSTIDGVNFIDDLPDLPFPMVVDDPPSASTTGCGTPTFTPTAGAGSISFSDGTLAPESSCIIKVDVTVPESESYENTTGHLFINDDVDTGNTATDTLTAEDVAACLEDTLMVEWIMDPSQGLGVPPAYWTKAENVSAAIASVGIPESGSIVDVYAHANSWKTWGYKGSATFTTADNDYVQFAVDTSHYSDIIMHFEALRDSPGPTDLYVYYDNGTGLQALTGAHYALPIDEWNTYTNDFTGLTNTDGVTSFRIYGHNANNDESGANLFLDNITFHGCSYSDPPPTLSKEFSPTTIPQNTVSTLTFTLSNTNASAVPLTGVTFSDELPPGLEVAALPNASTTCSGPPTWAPGAGDTLLTFSGASMAAGSSCTAQVDVIATTAGQFDNVSGYIASNESGENTGPDGYATATLTAIAPPIISKLFEDSPIFTDGLTTLQFTITNPNQSADLSGITFTDTLPGGVTVETSSGPQCGGTLTTTNPSTIDLSDGWLAADSSCTFGVTVTGATPGTKENVTSLVDSTEGDEGNSASDTLIVRDPSPSISLLKQLSTSPTGPWMSSIAVPTGANVYYRFVVENTGDVPLSPISITDDTLDVTSCNVGWESTTLPVAVQENDNHIVTCSLLEPVTAVEGSHTNTAHATGTYEDTPYDSFDSEATYATTVLTIEKSVQESYFTGAGETLHYSYLVTNDGYAKLRGPVTVTDDPAGAASCPEVTEIGDFDAFFDPGESITCSATYIIQEADVAAGSVANVAFATVDGATSPEDSETVPYRPLVDLVVTKTDGVAQYVPGGSLTYTIIVSNAGANPAIDAAFSDPRPPGISDWSWDCVATGAASCGETTSGTGDISVNDIDLPADAVSNYLTYTIDAIVDGAKTDDLVNIATVTAPAANVESNPADNTATDTDTLTPPVNLAVTKSDGVTEYLPGDLLTYAIVISNSGPNPAVDATFVDNRPAGISSWTWNCVASGTASCGETTNGTGDISVADIDLPTQPLSNYLTYTIEATVADGWSADLTNTASVSAPDGTYDTDTANNTASDTDTLKPVPGLKLTKTGILDNSVIDPDERSDPGDTIEYSFLLENTGNVTLNDLEVTDPLLPTLDCTIAALDPGESATCTATNNIYVLTQTDIEAGQVDNTATADSAETEPTTDSESVPLVQAPGLAIDKLVSEDGNTWVDQVWVDVGDTVYFWIRVANTGNVTLTELLVDDGMADCELIQGPDLSGDDNEIFDVGEEWQFVCSFLASPGTHTNTATADTAQTGEVSDDATYVGGSIFDPPSGFKTVNEVDDQVLQWTMIWINDANATAIDVTVSDPIPPGSAYDPSGAPSGYPVPGGAPDGSVNTGVACTDTSDITTTTACYFEGVTGLYPRGRVVWIGSLGPDPGAADAGEAEHEIVITFNLLVDGQVLSIENVATLNADLNGDGDYDDPGETPAASASASWEAGPPELPDTGFAPGRVTPLNTIQQPNISARGEVELEIPRLGIRIPILEIPTSGRSWDVSWLWDQAGLLAGTAFPGWPGNSVLAGHAYLATGLPGPFADLKDLRWGDEVIVHAYGLRHVYQVQERAYVLPDDVSVLRHEDLPWLTLITCTEYDEGLGAYHLRLAVRAVKVRVEEE